MHRKHIVITGTGRAGTTFLIMLLTNLGLETGFLPYEFSFKGNARQGVDHNARAGLELDIKDQNAPYIIKDPNFCQNASEIINNQDIEIEHVFIPMRDLYAAAESRRYVYDKAVRNLPLLERMLVYFGFKRFLMPGGLWQTSAKNRQEYILLNQIYQLTLTLSKTEIPVTLLNYPMLLKDSVYLFKKLRPAIVGIEFNHFTEVFKNTLNKKWAHSFGEADR